MSKTIPEKGKSASKTTIYLSPLPKGDADRTNWVKRIINKITQKQQAR